MFKYTLTALFSILFFSFAFAQPPACTNVLLTGNQTFIVNSGSVYCVPENSTYNGALVIRSGGHVVICVGTFQGSVTVDPGGTLWDSPTVTYTGALAVNGTRNSNASNCSTCSAPSSGTLTTPSAICSGQQTGITGSAVTGATYTWQKENTLNANDWVSIGGNTQNLAAGTIGNLTTTTRFRRRTSDCSPVQNSAWVTVTITVNPLPTNNLVAVDGERCGTGAVNLSVTGAASGTTVDWYAAASGGSVLTGGSGTTSFTTSSINTTTNFFAEVRNTTTGCVSSTRIPVTATVNALPSNPLVAVNGSRCGTGTVNLSVTGAAAGTTVDWYAAASGGSVLTGGSGTTSFTTPSISSTTQFFAEVRNTTTGCVSSSRIPVTATVNALPSNPLVAVDGERCGTGTVNLSVTGVAAGTTVDWYSAASGGSVLTGGSGTSSFTTPSINTTTNYYAEVRNTTTGCVSSTRVEVTATVNSVPSNNLVGVDGERCGTGTVNLSVTGAAAGTTVDWYAAASGGSVLTGGSGTSSFTTPSINTTTNYYAEVRNSTTGCVSSSRVEVTATVNSVPSNNLVAVDGERCGTGTVNLSVTGAAAGTTVDWYAAASGGSVLTGGTGTSSFTTPSINTTTKYYAEVRNSTTGCVSSSRVEVTATVNSVPSNNLVGVDGERCGTGTVNLSVTGAAAGTTVDWYSAASGGSVLTGGSGTSSFTTPSINTTTNYYAEVRNSTTGCVSSSRVEVTATINSGPTNNLVAVEDSICGPGTVNISVTGVGAGETVDWYAGATGGSVLTGGLATANFTTPSVSSTTTYYAELRNSSTGCVSTVRIPVDARVNEVPNTASLIGVEDSICGPGTVNISVTGAGAGETIDWYADATGGSVLTGGLATVNYSTPSINTSTTYFAELRNATTGCVSSVRIPVDARVNDVPNTGSLIGVEDSICGSGTVNISVTGVGAGETIDWYADATGGSVLTGGLATANFTTPSINISTTYYAELRNVTTGCVSSVRIPVDARVNEVPNTGSLVGVEDSICGPGTVNISVTGIGAGETIDWYADATGGSVLTGGLATANFTTPSINISTTYYAELRNSTTGCVSTLRIPVNARVNEVPSIGSIVGVEDSICGPGTVNISVIGVGAGETIDWYADAIGGSVLTGGLATANFTTPSINTSTTYYAELRNSTTGCVSSTRIPVDARVNEVPNTGSIVGVEDSICGSGTLNISVTGVGAGETIDWYEDANGGSVLSGGLATANFTTPSINTSTTYYAELRNSTTGCVSSTRIPVEAIINTIPTNSLTATNGSNCGPGNVLLSVTGFQNNETVDWYADETGGSVLIDGLGVDNYTTLLISNTTTYYAELRSDTSGCVSTGRIPVIANIYSFPEVNLGQDTSICIESDYVLNAGNQGVDYLWSTNATSATISTAGANTYWVRVINADGCTTSDTIVVDNHPSPAMSLNIPDTNICLLDTIVLDGGVWDEYQWNYNNSSSQTINVFAAGTYILTVKNEFGCFTSDTTVVGIYQLPNSNLGQDREVCLYKNVDITVPELDAIYLWSTNENTRTISTNQPGTYTVVVTNNNGCSTKDTIVLNPGIDLEIDLGDDVTICPGVIYGLELFGYDSIRWSTGENTERIQISSTQKIDVLAVDENGCWGRDTIQITSVSNPSVKLMNDTTICELEQEVIDIKVDNEELNVKWNTGSENHTISVNSPGTFIVTVTDINSCSAKDTVIIAPYCRPITITMPNVFTPNNDGFNDTFYPLEFVWEDENYMQLNLTTIHFGVYNRWGQKVHESSETLPSWNGYSVFGGIAPAGTYFWVLEYELINGEYHKKNGYVQLIGN
jgi:gliding motility-associated-like protein